MRELSFLGVVALSIGCSEEPAGRASDLDDVSGKWCGKQVSAAADCVGDEVSYLELAQTGNVVTGVRCEAYQKDCYELQSGTYRDDQLTFFYTFDEYRVDGDFQRATNDTMSGALFSDKCACEIEQTLYRIP